MPDNSIISAVEAVLFACGEPVEISRLAYAAETEEFEIPNIIDALNKRYENSESSLNILKLGNSYQIATKKEFSKNIKLALEAEKNTPLSNAAMEVLTIIAYNQPVSKSFISHVRGIESGNIVNSLVERELLEEAGRLDVPGKPIAYKTTDVFLRCFGIESIDDLDPIPDVIPDGEISDENISEENLEENE